MEYYSPEPHVEHIVILLERIAVALEALAGKQLSDTEDNNDGNECIWGLIRAAAKAQVAENKKTAALTLSMVKRYSFRTWGDVRKAMRSDSFYVRNYSKVSHDWFVEFARLHGESLPEFGELR
jgi:hypothetical protein